MAEWYFIHGAASSRLTWTRQMRVIPSAKRAELPALNDVNPDHLIEAWAEWCLNDLNKPSIIVGHSMGGAIAQMMALKSPTQVRGLVLVGTGPRLPVNPALIEALRQTPAAALEQITRWSLSRTPEPELLANSLEQARAYDPDRAIREFLACSYFDVRSRLATIRCPRVLIGADQDRMTPIALLEEFRAIWPDVPLHVVHGAGHLMMLEKPDAFNDILLTISQTFAAE